MSAGSAGSAAQGAHLDRGLAVHRQIAARAAAAPDTPAVTDGARTLTYRDLQQRADQLANHLCALGVRPDEVVGVCLPRGHRLITTLLGVLRSGAAYLPLDPAYPDARLKRLLDDARPRLVIADAATRDRLPVSSAATVVDLDRQGEEIASCPATDPDVAVDHDHLAYVVYTSGSTGAPKGVMVAHRGLANLAAWHVRTYRITDRDRCGHLAAIGFDASVWEIWPPLAAGASLHVPNEADRTEPQRLAHWLAAKQITVTFVPTPLAEELLRVPEHRSIRARTILVGGDVLSAPPPPGTPFELVNHYGPTEASVVATAAPIPQGGNVVPPIGLPIDHVSTHLLDERLRPVPPGSAGELYLGGPGLARGYANSPGLSAQRFVADPGGCGTRLYRSGDVVRSDAAGTLDFVGRRDDQVSLRGVRIELGEVAARLRAHPDVADATAVVRPAPNGHDQLVGYIVATPGTAPRPTAVLAELRRVLPAAMVPAVLVAVPRFPLTPHGKVDRAALPEPAVEHSAGAQAPRDDLEAVVAALWYDLLGLSGQVPDVHADFLALGGHSLLAHQIAARLRDRLGADLPMHAAMSTPTIATLAALIRDRHPEPARLAVIARVQRQIDELSDDEVDGMLADLEETSR